MRHLAVMLALLVVEARSRGQEDATRTRDVTVAGLLDQLQSHEFRAREKATAALKRLGTSWWFGFYVKAQLREVKTGDVEQARRVADILSHIRQAEWAAELQALLQRLAVQASAQLEPSGRNQLMVELSLDFGDFRSSVRMIDLPPVSSG